MKTTLCILLFLPVSLAAQMSSTDYSSPANGVASSGGLLQSADYAASGTVIWYDCSLISSVDYHGSGIGNAEVANGNVTGVEENVVVGNGSSVSPNPLTEQSALNITLETETTVRLSLYDVTGVELYAELPGNRSIGKHSFPLREFFKSASASGVFMLKIDLGNKVEVIKILKF